jgi:hypothetical protein
MWSGGKIVTHMIKSLYGDILFVDNKHDILVCSVFGKKVINYINTNTIKCLKQ